MTKNEKPSNRQRDLQKVYKADRKKRPPHLIDEDEQKQIESLRRAVVEAVTEGEGQKALELLKELGYGPESA